jgi:hypothetical protein
MRGEITSASMRVPLCCTHQASGLRGVPRSTCAVNGSPLTVPPMQMSFSREWLVIA